MINIDRALKIDGWMLPDELRWLAERASEHHIIAEVGVFLGRTTAALTDNTDGIVFSIDPWNCDWFTSTISDANPGHEMARKHPMPFYEFLHEFITDIKMHRIVPIIGTIRDFCRSADMVFIDGDHSYKQVIEDIEHAMIALQKGGLICGHDYGDQYWPDVKRAVDDCLYQVANLVGTIWYKMI